MLATNLSSTQPMNKTYGKRPYTPTYFHHHQEEYQGGLRRGPVYGKSGHNKASCPTAQS